MSLRGRPVEQRATLPDGRDAALRIGVAEDSYIARSEIETVTLELTIGGEPAAALATVLELDQESEALQLAREIVAGLESGALEPTAGALESLITERP